MIISCLYPKKIFIDDEKIKEQVEKLFCVEVNVGEWFDCSPREIDLIDSENKNQNIDKKQTGFNNTIEKGEKNKQFYDINVTNYNLNSFSVNKNLKYNITYIVKPMDTYEKVAKKLNISVDELKKIVKTKNLFVGQRIDI